MYLAGLWIGKDIQTPHLYACNTTRPIILALRASVCIGNEQKSLLYNYLRSNTSKK